MKTSPILSFCRNSFYFLEWATAVSVVVLIVLTWIVTPYQVTTPHTGPGITGWGPPIYRFRFSLPHLQTNIVEYRGASNDSVMITNLSADVLVSHAGNPSRLLTFLRYRAMAETLSLALVCAICSLLRRLFDNAKAGEAFSLKSVRLIRRIGWCCVFFALTTCVVNSGLDGWIANDLRQHLSISDITTGFFSADPEGGLTYGLIHVHLDLTTLLVGLLAFALAEVFRQGVLMKEENELTV